MLNDFVIVKVSTQKHVLTTNTKRKHDIAFAASILRRWGANIQTVFKT